MMTRCIALLFLCTAPVVTNGSTHHPSRPLLGQTIRVVSDGDYVHPAFSPDGSKLAFSGVIVRDKLELAELLVATLQSGAVTRLLDDETSRRYAVYKTFAYGTLLTRAATIPFTSSIGRPCGRLKQKQNSTTTPSLPTAP